MILDKIIEKKKIQLDQEMKDISFESLEQSLKTQEMKSTKDFYNAIKRKNEISIIAEVKKASPSKGIIKENFEPLDIAKQYFEANVQAISVLTEKDFFLGDNEFLKSISQALPTPLLRKDFIIDIWQVYQSRYLGADAILLIAAILSDNQLKEYQKAAEALGMQCLTEVHDREELERVLQAGANIIGVNNRNLRTFEVDLKTTEQLKRYIPNDKAVVSESGIKTLEDMKYLRESGIDAVLIGETFMRAPSIIEKINELRIG
jgi:indole-3-glycerol phosphate synthase